MQPVFSRLAGLALLCLPFAVKAQADQQLIQKYPVHIVLKVNEIISKVPLPVTKQLLLAGYFKERDSIAAQVLKKGGALTEASKYVTFKPADLQPLLSRAEWLEYTSSDPGSLLVKAVKSRKELRLSVAQTDSLAVNEARITAENSTNKSALKQQELKKILSEKQYELFWFMDNAHLATAETHKNWLQLKKYGLIPAAADTSLLYKQLYQFQLNRLQAIARAPLHARDSIIRRFQAVRPRLLYQLDRCQGNLPGSEYSSVLKYAAELTLTDLQINRILSYVIELEQIRREAPGYDSGPNQRKGIAAVLKPQQLEAYISIKSKERAQGNVLRMWEDLVRFGLNTGLNKENTLLDTYNYEFRYLIAVDKHNFINTPATEAGIVKAAAARPAFMRKLDMFMNRLPGGELATVLKYRSSLELNQAQTDTLLRKVTEAEVLKADFGANHADPRPYLKQLTMKSILSTLSQQQFERYLEEKHRLDTKSRAFVYWQELREKGLDKGMDKEEQLAIFEQYEFKRLIAADYADYQRIPLADSLKGAVLAAKPFILWKLDAYQGRLPSAELASLFKNRQMIGLRPGQADTLVLKSIELEILKNNWQRKYGTGLDPRPFERTTVTQLLNSKQLILYTFARTGQRASASAYQLWLKIEEAGVTKGLDPVKEKKEVLNFEQRRLAADSRLYFENTPQNLVALKTIENAKPKSLRLLEDVEKEKRAVALKQSYTW